MLTNARYGLIKEKTDELKTIEDLIILLRISYNCAKWIILQNPDLFSFNFNQKDIDCWLNNNNNKIKDIHNLEIIDMYSDDHLPCVVIWFQETPSSPGMFAEILHCEFGPGMALYWNESQKIKEDILIEINKYFTYRSEQKEYLN